MNKSNWILKNGMQSIDSTSFPVAFRTAFNIVRKTIEAKKNPSDIIKGLIILGPVDSRGDRTKYNYAQATELATGMGLLQPDGEIRSKEFTKKDNFYN
jgi:hypothetical protein